MQRGSSDRTIRPRRARRRLVAGLLVSAALVAAAPQPAQAAARPVERQFARMVNATREASLLGSMTVSDRLSDVARRHTRRMAEQGQLYHSNLERLLGPGVSSVGENVGYGDSLEQLLAAFMASPPHAENILGGYRRTGVGVVRVDGQYWVTQIFAA